jgi:hypothetical protein
VTDCLVEFEAKTQLVDLADRLVWLPFLFWLFSFGVEKMHTNEQVKKQTWNKHKQSNQEKQLSLYKNKNKTLRMQVTAMLNDFLTVIPKEKQWKIH